MKEKEKNMEIALKELRDQGFVGTSGN